MTKWKALVGPDVEGYIFRWIMNSSKPIKLKDFDQIPYVAVTSLQFIYIYTEPALDITAVVATVKLDGGGLYTIDFSKEK